MCLSMSLTSKRDVFLNVLSRDVLSEIIHSSLESDGPDFLIIKENKYRINRALDDENHLDRMWEMPWGLMLLYFDKFDFYFVCY